MRLLLWYGADFGRDIPTRLARLLTMVTRPPDLTGDLTGNLTGDLTGEVGYDGNDKQYYAHACLTGVLRRYQQQQQQQQQQESQTISPSQQQQQQPQQPPQPPPTDVTIEYNVYNWTVNDISSS